MPWGECLGIIGDEIQVLNELSVALFTEGDSVLSKFSYEFLLEIFFEIIRNAHS